MEKKPLPKEIHSPRPFETPRSGAVEVEERVGEARRFFKERAVEQGLGGIPQLRAVAVEILKF